MSVRLLLDDVMSQDGAQHDVRADLEARVRNWFAFAGADDSALSVGLFSATLTPELLAQRAGRREILTCARTPPRSTSCVPPRSSRRCSTAQRQSDACWS